MKLSSKAVRSSLAVKLRSGTLAKAMAAAEAGAGVDEVREILKSGLMTTTGPGELVSISPIVLLTDHPLAGAL